MPVNALEDIYEIKGDAKDPLGQVEGGRSSTIGFSKAAIGRPVVRYGNFLLTCDVYGVGEGLYVHLYCPKCRNALSIPATKKQIDYDRVKNVLSVEPFRCTWETDPEGRRMEFGLGMCGWSVGISNNVARDA